jgi:bifunctional DNase/RNase
MSGWRRFGVVGVVVVALGGGLGPSSARESTETPAPKATGPQEVEVLAAYVDPGSQTPVVVLRGKRDKRTFPMVIDPAQLTAIALPLKGITPHRPLTHDLFLTLFGRLQVTLTRAVITDFRDDVYYATLHLTGSGGEMVLDARPSDAIALAIRAKIPVLVEDRVLEKGGRLPAGPQRPHI